MYDDIFHPERYHGAAKRPPFFEGWYFKVIPADLKNRMAFIPGIILGKDAHAFVQVLDGERNQAEYFRFPAASFAAARDPFSLQIEGNLFDLTRMEIRLTSDRISYQGAIQFETVTPWPVTLLSPGIMGWYSWIPRMQCYHGVLGFNHRLRGFLQADGKQVRFDGGKGYIEKDWGQAFPEGWVWMQSNHFSDPELSLTASVAIIPWLGAAFRGFIIGVWRQGRLLRFTSYTGARIEHLSLSEDSVTWIVSGGGRRLELMARRAKGSALLGPTVVDMGKRVDETLDARIHIRLLDSDGQLLMEDEGLAAGLEVQGPVEKLLSKP
jgi:tocopherol cyclase